MEQVIEEHVSEFGCQPVVIISAPARFHLLGDHSWYFRDKTLSMAVNLPVYVAISLRTDTALRFHFPQLKERKRANLSTLKFRKEDRWANSVKAMIYGFQSLHGECRGMNITVYSDILPSAGFGITTAIKAASAIALCKLYDFSASNNQIVEIVERGNKFFLGMSNFTSDIFTVLFARKNSCVLTDHETGKYVNLPFKFKNVSIVLTDARVPRVSVWSEESLRSADNLELLSSLKNKKNDSWEYEQSDTEINDALSSVNEDVRRRLICLIKEHQFVVDAAAGLKETNFSQFARSINKSHEFLRDLYLISCPEIDWLIKRVMEFDTSSSRNPTACARITGKGFGRCTYTILQDKDVDEYMKKLSEYERIFGFHPVSYIVKPVAGACVTAN